MAKRMKGRSLVFRWASPAEFGRLGRLAAGSLRRRFAGDFSLPVRLQPVLLALPILFAMPPLLFVAPMTAAEPGPKPTGKDGTKHVVRDSAVGNATALTKETALPEEKRAVYSRQAARQKYRRPGPPPYPKENAYTPARHELGKALFFDPRLSASGITSCATCHNPSFSWGDGMARAVGHGMKTLGRRTPTILNLAWGSSFFWDGRAESLEEQALGPIQAEGEMNLPLADLVGRLQGIKGYAKLFAEAYPGEAISTQTVAKAIATYERSIVSGTAPFDRWIAGDERAISEEAKRGFDLFQTKAKCAACHTGWNFTDDGFYDIGIAQSDKAPDLGRGKVLPGMEAVQYAFKTPTLRNVTARAPYMHDGSVATLEAVIDHYDRGGDAPGRPSLSPDIVKLQLTSEEKRALLRFLESLSGRDQPVVLPLLPQ